MVIYHNIMVKKILQHVILDAQTDIMGWNLSEHTLSNWQIFSYYFQTEIIMDSFGESTI